MFQGVYEIIEKGVVLPVGESFDLPIIKFVISTEAEKSHLLIVICELKSIFEVIIMFKVGIITASDKGYSGEREDRSGEVIAKIMEEKGYTVEKKSIVPDEIDVIFHEIVTMSDDLNVDLILTTGGTGFSPRDVTPEATIKACDRMANGISEAIRYYSLQITPRAMLSRAVSGIRGRTLVINLPGSPKAVKESLDFILDSLYHGLEILTGCGGECARK